MFADSLKSLSKTNYLGSPSVVDRLVREFVRDCMDPTNWDAIETVVSRYGAILGGADRAWEAPEGRLTRESLGRDLAVAYRVDDMQSMVDIARCALAEMAAKLFNALAESGGDHEAVRPVVDSEVEKMVMTVLGAGAAVAEESE